ncbi:MAG: hypothetical protein EOO68_08445 [Moraxellaceae bacterium]|nr:MAG: hypothetical protein EOO68_08445 [Moraxellaceae bacterium]
MDWFRNLPIARKQILMLISAALLPIIILGTLSYSVAKRELTQSALQQLTAVRDLKAAAINRHFNQARGGLTSLAMSEDVQTALLELTRGFNSLDTQNPPALTPLVNYYESQFAAEYKNATTPRFQQAHLLSIYLQQLSVYSWIILPTMSTH